MTAPEPTPGPWEYVPSTEHHGPYITSEFGSTIADFYTMTRPDLPATINGGPSRPVPFLHEMADPNARLAAASPNMLEALRVTAGNIRSLGPAGAIPEPYKVWLKVVEDAIAKATPTLQEPAPLHAAAEQASPAASGEDALSVAPVGPEQGAA